MAEKKFKGKVEIDLGDLGKARAEIQKLREELELKRAPEKIAALRSELDGLKAGSKEAATTLKDGFKAAFTTIAAGFTAIRIKSFMDSAVKDFNKLETTLLGLQATARLTGNNFDKLKKSVTDLSKDGVLSLDQATTSMKTLLAQGIKADKAFELLNAAKKVSAFNNIVGDTGQGVADFVKFLQTGSAELAENMDPSIVKVVKSLGGYEKVASDAAAKQKLINEVIKKGSSLNGEYQTFLESGTQAQVSFDQATLAFSQTLGQKLQPAYTSTLNAGSQVLSFITGALDKLGSSTVTIGIVALGILALGKAASVAGGQFGFMWAELLGPISLAIAAVAALTAVLVEVEDRSSPERTVKNFKEQANSLREVAKRADELNAVHKRTIAQEQELAAVKEKLRERAAALGIDYDKLAKAAGGAAEATKKLIAEEKKLAEQKIRQDLRQAEDLRMSAENDFAGLSSEQSAIVDASNTMRGLPTRKDAKRLGEIRAQKAKDALKRLEEDDAALNAKPQTAIASGPAQPEFRFVRARDELAKLRKEYESYIAIHGEQSDKGMEALERFDIESERIRTQLVESLAQYTEDSYAAEKLQIERAYDEQRANIYELANLKAITEEEQEQALQKIRKQNIQNNANLQLKAFKDTLSGANDILNAIQGAKGGDAGKQIGAFGGGLQGLAKASKGISGLTGVTDIFGKAGPIGEVLAVGGSLISGIMSAFGEDEAERARQQAERDAMALKVMQSQESLTKQLLDFQKSQAETPFKQLQTQLRLIDLQGNQRKIGASDSQLTEIERETVQKKLAAVNDVLKSEGQSYSGGQFFTDVLTTPEGLASALSQSTGYSASIGLLQSIVNDVAGSRGQSAEKTGIDFYTSRLNTIAGLNLPPVMKQAALDFISSVAADGFYRVARDNGINTDQDVFLASIGQRSRYGAQIFGLARSFESGLGGRAINTSTSAVDSLIGEFQADTSRLENLFSLFDQQTALSQQIADNTKKTAQNTEIPANNALSFVNIGKGFTQSLGMVNAPVNSGALSLPSGLGTIALASQRLDAVNDSNLSRLDKMIELEKLQVGLLGVIAAKEAGVSGLDLEQVRRMIVEINADAAYRKVA